MAIVHLLRVVLVSALFYVGAFSESLQAEDCPKSTDSQVFIKVYGDTCYYFHLKEKKTYEQAQETCQTSGRKLIQPRSEAANGYLWFLILYIKKSDDHVWLGAIRDKAKDSKKHFWVSGGEIPSSLVPSLLKYGVPYTVPRVNGIWHFEKADKKETHPFVCELQVDKDAVKQVTTTQPPATTTTSTISTTTEQTTSTSTTTTTTTTRKTTPPTQKTTAASTTPPPPIPSLVSKLCPRMKDREKYMKLFGHICFYFQMKETENYLQASKICQNHGGKLAILKSELLDHFAQYHMQNTFQTTKGVWIGLHTKPGDDKTFVWEDGSPLTYSNFNTVKKETKSANQPVVMKYGYNNKWYSMWETIKMNYICQFQAQVQA